MVYQKRTPMQVVSFLLALIMLVISIMGISKVFASTPDETMNSVTGSTSGITSGLAAVVNPETKEEMYVAKSTFYDYYSDSQVGKGSTPKAIDDGVYGTSNRSTENSFTKFNNVLLKEKNYGNTSKSASKYPLYMGLFFSDQSSDDNGGFYYNDDPAKNDEKNFYLASNSSQQGGGKNGAVTNVNTATQGLVDSSLTENGDITQSNNGKSDILPYFDKDFLTNTNFDNSSLSLGTVSENVSFPFKKVDKNGVTYYKFDSREDTVRFNDKGQLDYLGVNKEQVYDQKKEDGVNIKPGFFPYNSASDSDSTRLDYGFGVKIEIPFNITADGKINGQDIVFDFSGDDDVWVYIDNELALDIGGAHSRVEGTINFAKKTSTVSGVKNNIVAFAQKNWWYLENRNYSSNDTGLTNILSKGQTVPGIFTNKTDDFSDKLIKSLSDTSKTHTLTLFYMERGKIESNMMINFNLPEPNQLKVTNSIDYSDVNKSLLEQTKNAGSTDEFKYDVVDKDMNSQDNPILKDGEATSYVSKFCDNDTLMLTEKELADGTRSISYYYNTKWLLSDLSSAIASSQKRDAYTVSDGRVEENDAFLFKNISSDNSPKLNVDYTNKVLVNSLSITKKLNGEDNDDEFTFNIVLDDIFGKDSDEVTYSSDYDVYEGEKIVDTKTAESGNINIKANQTAVIKGIPVGTKYTINELSKEGYYVDNVVMNGTDENIDFSNGVVGKVVVGTVDDNSYIYTNAVEVKPTVEPTTEPTLEPTIEPTIEPTEEPTIEPTIEDTIEPTDEPLVIESTTEPTDEPIVIEQPTVPKDVKPAIDNSPKTGDASNAIIWIVSMIVSAGLVIFTGAKLIFRKKLDR